MPISFDYSKYGEDFWLLWWSPTKWLCFKYYEQCWIPFWASSNREAAEAAYFQWCKDGCQEATK